MSFMLDTGDAIRGTASVAAVVDYTAYGLDGTSLKQLADGQLASSETDVYLASGIDTVTTIVLVNTDTSTRTVNLYCKPSGGTSRRIIPKDLSLAAGYSLHTDGNTIRVFDTSGLLMLKTASTGAVLETDFDATTFLYATSDDTPEPKTPAETMAILSGAAGADFSMNTHKLTNVVDPASDQDAATKKYVDAVGYEGLSVPIPIFQFASISSTPNTATVSSVSTDTITLTANEAYRFWHSEMDDHVYLKIVNTSKAPVEYAWVKASPAVNQLQVTVAGDISGWANTNTISTAEDGVSSSKIEIDCTPGLASDVVGLVIMAAYLDTGAWADWKGITMYADVSAGGVIYHLMQVQNQRIRGHWFSALPANYHLYPRVLATGTDTATGMLQVVGYFKDG